jgi:large subunit ribosomal protein L19
MNEIIRAVEQEYLKPADQVPSFRPGDTVKVHLRLVDEVKQKKGASKGDKSAQGTRVQAFEGVCIARKGSSIDTSFTLRRMSGQIGVERTFLVHSPHIDKIEVTRLGRVRRAKLYYLRGRVGKASRVKAARYKGV